MQPLPNTDLSDGELTSLLTFSQSVLSPNPSAPPTVHDLQPSYERAEASRTALVKNLRETVGREMALTETRDKMREIMRLYEARLDRQLQRSTANQYSHYAAPPQQPHLPAYPHQYTQTRKSHLEVQNTQCHQLTLTLTSQPNVRLHHR